LVRKSLVTIERDVCTEQNKVEGRLNITAPKQFVQSVLVDICHEFCQQYPLVKISIDSSYTPHDLTSTDFDLAFRATVNPPENMIAKKLIDYYYICCASPVYIEDKGSISDIAELTDKNHQCLTGQAKGEWQFKSGVVNIDGWLAINDNALLKQEALKGRGIIQVPNYVVKQELAQGTLVEVLVLERAVGQSIYVLQPQLINSPLKVSTFVQFTKDFLT